jgi:hypothetical protein
MSWLRRCLRLGQRLGDFVLNLSIRRSGRIYELRGNVHDAAGDFACRARAHDWRGALRDLVKTMTRQLHDQCVRRGWPRPDRDRGDGRCRGPDDQRWSF